jgi:tripartite-type tricarboxylate transporter receptor subunit TctC
MTSARLGRRIMLVAGAAAALPRIAFAQGEKLPIKILIGFPPGGATDAIGRVVVDRLPAILGQPVVVENKPGIGGRLAADAVLAAPADGLTFMVAPNATPTFQTLVYKDQLRWDMLRDFSAVAAFVVYPLGMGVALNTGVRTAKDFVAWAKANPKQASFGTPGLGGQNHFLGVALGQAIGAELQVVPYKGTPPMVTDLVGGQLPAAISLLDGMLPQHRANKVRVIGIFSKQRSPLMNDIPTFAEQGIDVTGGDAWTGMWARAGTPPAALARVQDAVRQVLQQADVKETLSQKLWAQPAFRTGAETDAMLRAEIAYWAPIIQASGFKPS